MEKVKVDSFLAVNAGKFQPWAMPVLIKKLEEMPDDRYPIALGTTLWDPTIILLIAILLGWDRFFLGEIGLGILKVITCYGLGIWWLIDIFTAMDRTKKYNLDKILALP